VLFLLVLAGPLLASSVRLPGLVGLIAVGMLVGPNVLGIVDGSVLLDALGFVGLLYLLFQGGLDLDLGGFAARPRESIIFGTATFVLPLIGVTAVAVAAGLPWLGAVIIGSALTSHTPLTLPIVSRAGLARNPMVTATLGATLLATTGALLVLAVAAAAAGDGTSLLAWLLFLLGLVAYVFVMLRVVPRVTRWFFRGLGQDRDVRLTYLLSGMGLAAVVAGLLGIEPIVGAFLAGVAFNRFVPDGTVIADRVTTLGRSLFIPAFLISTGMMLDPVALVTDPRTLWLGALFVAAEVATKWLASTTSGRLLGATRPERGIMFSLSVGQAAGALAAAVVGQELGILGTAEVNAIILVIMVSALIAGITADRNVPAIEPPDTATGSLGRRVVVPVSNPATTAALVRVAGSIAAVDSGAVVPVNVLAFDATAAQVRAQRQLSSAAEQAALASGAEVHPAVRVDASTDAGVLHSIVEQDGTCVVMGWKGFTNRRESLFGTVIDRVLDISPVPVLVCRPGDDDRHQRIVVVVTHQELEPSGRTGIDLVVEVADRLSRDGNLPVAIVTDEEPSVLLDRLPVSLRGAEVRRGDAVLRSLRDIQQEGDLVLTLAPPIASRLGRGARRVAQAAPGRTVVVAVPRILRPGPGAPADAREG
jgi:Kef-type K+ transport system membrane component KefB